MKSLYQFIPVNDHIQAIHTPTQEILYLIQGKEAALLIDTSCGLGDLKGEVESVVKTPYSVALTHGHLDHAGGVSQFDNVYMNEADLPLYREMNSKEMQGYIAVNAPDLVNEPRAAFAPDYNFQPLEEGHVFDLGGIHVSAWKLAGHTPGSMVFLMEEDGILITGDAANTNTFLFMPEALSVQAYLQNLKRAVSLLEGKYHRVFLSHRDVDSSPRMLEEGIAVCENVLNGISDQVPFDFLGYHGNMAKEADENLKLADGTFFNMVYNPEKL